MEKGLGDEVRTDKSNAICVHSLLKLKMIKAVTEISDITDVYLRDAKMIKTSDKIF